MKGTSSNPRSRVFISYSHSDADYLKRLQIHLEPYVREGTVDFWDDTKLEPGLNWREEIRQAIASAKIAVLLVSADFLASEFITRNELPPLLAAAKQEGTIILTVILSPCIFDDTDLAQFQTVNAPSRPLSSMTGWKRDEVWVKVAKRIKGILERQHLDMLSTMGPHADDSKHPVLRENFDHLIVTHTQLFAGREDIISGIHKYIDENLSGYIFIEGLSGYGKTSLLAKIVQNHPEFAYHFISQAYRTYGSDFNLILPRICGSPSSSVQEDVV
ncbi:MAG: toll/interleukin-1 receptor domain-containing protein [Ktedonobacteraceae bacterium]